MSEQTIDALEREHCKALFITNVLGFAGDLEEIKKRCDERGIILLEDNCESLGTELHSGKTGNFGLASSFSFFVAHQMSTVEGGMVTTDDRDFAEMLRIVRANGWDRNLSPNRQNFWRKKFGVQNVFQASYTFYDLGFNFRPTEITGFLGLKQLSWLDESINIREKNFLYLSREIKKNPDFINLEYSRIKKLSAFAIPFVCKTKELRDKYVKKFTVAGIEVRPMIAGNIQLQPFYKKYINITRYLPGADFLHNNSFYCGNCPDYTAEDLKIIINAIKTKGRD